MLTYNFRNLAVPFGLGFIIALALIMAFAGAVEIASAQSFFDDLFNRETATTATTTLNTNTPTFTTSTVPGVLGLPNTGLGGESAGLLLSTAMAVVALAGLVGLAIAAGRKFAR